MIPNDHNRTITVQLLKCNLEPFGKSGTAEIHVNGVARWENLDYSSGVSIHEFTIDPLARGISGTNSYRIYIYPDEETGPPHISGTISAWDEQQ